jgi:hypothetical protein
LFSRQAALVQKLKFSTNPCKPRSFPKSAASGPYLLQMVT